MNNLTLSQFTATGRNGQLVLSLNSEILLPENAPVRLTRLQLEELDYRKLYEAYSSKGRKSKVDPSVLFQVIAYAYQCGIYSSRKIEEACRYRVDFLWLLDDQEAPDHATIARFRTGRCKDALEDLFYQLVAKLRIWAKSITKPYLSTEPRWRVPQDGIPSAGGKILKSSLPK